MKTVLIKLLITLLSVIASLPVRSQLKEAEQLATTFWQYVQGDSSAFALKEKIGHNTIDEIKLAETLLTASLQFGKPSLISRKGVKESISTSGLMGKGRYICFTYRNMYSDTLTGENTLFEKLLFFKKNKKDGFKLVDYQWSRRGTDITCD